MIDRPTLVWGAMDWLAVAAVAGGVLLILLAWGYGRAGSVGVGLRVAAAGMKVAAIALLASCLLEPLYSGQRARPGANKFAVLADNSQSMTLKDQGQRQTRGEELRAVAGKDAAWLAQIGRDFDLRQFAFDSQLRTTDDLGTLAFDGRTTDMGAALERILRRYQGQPLAGILLFTDGSVTDRALLEKLVAQGTAAGGGQKLPPIYPVLLGGTPSGDVSVESVAVSQTNFEDAPVTLTAAVVTSGEKGKNVVAEVLDEAGKTVEKQQTRVDEDGRPVVMRFRVKPEQPGLSFYKVRAAVEGQTGQFDHPETSTEATLANNTRLAVVDRGHGPFRVLYVTGRPNWEYKFLQRSLASDGQIELTGLIRVAKREPKFNFISRDSANPLFKGFDPQATETAEQYDQPIIMRVTQSGDKIEPHMAFPKTAEELDSYHAIMLDRVESEFFTQDQMQLIKEFVRQRGGGLMMLGGEESFKNGKYDRSPIGDVLPVYCDEIEAYPPTDATFRLALTREGWLEPFLRLRPEETQETQRLLGMPPFQMLNAVRGIKPGATVLARALVDSGMPMPAIVEQHFGRGRAAALLIGDLWAWQMHQSSNTQTDFQKAWRQMVRWLVAEVPQRLEATAMASADSEEAAGTMRIVVQVRDATYGPQDNATVSVKVTPPDGKAVSLRAEASLHKPGQYEAAYVARQPGAYRAMVTVTGPDGADLGQTETGWASDPAAEEFRALAPDRALLEQVARATGGQMVAANGLADFAAALPTRHAMITEPYVKPFWHQSWVFLAALALLAAEWGLRRWKGLP